jgi:hypothetical protein
VGQVLAPDETVIVVVATDVVSGGNGLAELVEPLDPRTEPIVELGRGRFMRGDGLVAATCGVKLVTQPFAQPVALLRAVSLGGCNFA